MKLFRDALGHLEKFLEIAEKMDDIVQKQRAYATLGRTHYQYAESVILDEENNTEINKIIEESEKAFLRALDICMELNDKVDCEELSQMRCRVYHNLGLLADMKDESPSIAISFISQALEICCDHNLQEDAYRAFSELARIHLRIGQNEKALQEAKESLNVANKIKNKNFIVESHAIIAYIDLVLDDFIAAKKNYYKGYKMKHSCPSERELIEDNLKIVIKICSFRHHLSKCNLSDSDAIVTNEKLGDCYVGLKVNPGYYQHYDHAIKFYKKTLELSQESGKDRKYLAVIYTSIAKTYADKKQFDKALEYYKMEFDFQSDLKEQVITLIEMAKLSDSSQADIYYQQALDLAAKVNHPKLKMHVIRSHLDSANIVDYKKKMLKNQLAEMSETYGIDADFELTEDEQSEDESVHLESIEFSDSDEEFYTTKSRRRQGHGLKVKRTLTGDTPLHVAAIKNNIEQAKKLLQQKHGVNLRDYSGWLPIHEAANHGHVEMVKLLIEAGAHINDRGQKDCSGITPLHDAASNGHLEVIKVLLKNGASVLSRDDKGLTPLDHLISYTSRENLSCDRFQEVKAMQNYLLECMKNAGYQISDSVKQQMIAVVAKEKQKEISFNSNSREEKSNAHCDSSSLYKPKFLVKDKVINQFDHFAVSNEKSATDAYKKAIKNVGSHSKQKEQESINDSYKTATHIPLISEESYFDGISNWLIDDGDLMTKKRKRHDSCEFEYKEKSRRSTITNLNTNGKKKTIQPKISNMTGKISCNNIKDAYKKTSDNGSPISNETVLCDELDRIIPSEEIKSLSRRSIDNFDENVLISKPSHFNASFLNPLQTNLRLSIQIFNKKFLIPVSCSAMNNTICWLEEEVSKNYMEYAKVKLKLNLITSKNEILNPNDLICMTLPSDQCELIATNIEVLNLPPLPNLYSQACHGLHLPEYADVVTSLRNAESSYILDLSNKFFRSDKDLKPIIQAIQHQNLQIIQLNSCRVQDSNFALFLESMTSLTMLQTLEMKACSLTVESFEKLRELAYKEPNAIRKLTHLDLSYNDFSDMKFCAFKSILSFPSLVHLNLQSCNIVLSHSSNIEFSCSLRILKLDFNEISLGCFSNILNCCSYLYHLSVKESLPQNARANRIGLSSSPVFGTASKEPCIGDSLSKLLCVGIECTLKHLDISSCGVLNEDVRILSSHLHRCKALNYLNLSNNSFLTSTSVMLLLQSILDNSEIHLKTLLLHGINSLCENDSFINMLEKVLESKRLSSHPFTSISFPSSVKNRFLTEKLKESYADKAVISELLSQLFFSLKL